MTDLKINVNMDGSVGLEINLKKRKREEESDGKEKKKVKKRKIKPMTSCKVDVRYNEAGDVIQKECTQCKVMLELDKFAQSPHGFAGRYSICKDCANAKAREKARLKRESQPKTKTLTKPDGKITHKECKTCHNMLSLEMFYKSKDGLGGRLSHCIGCIKQIQQKRYAEAKQTVQQRTVTEQKCKTCNIIKPAQEFAQVVRNSTGLDSQCRECEAILAKKANQAKSDYVREEKQKVGRCENSTCEHKHNNNWIALDFAHKNREEKALNKKGRTKKFKSLTLEQMKIERKLVKVICVNCHRLETREENKRIHQAKIDQGIHVRKAPRVKLIARECVNTEKLRRRCCVDCGALVNKDNFIMFDFDHIDKKTKISSISQMVIHPKPPAEIEKEMAKCVLRCGNCHRYKTTTNKEYENAKNRKSST